jgi:hypothetical protein
MTEVMESPNENKMSDGGRDRVSFGVKVHTDGSRFAPSHG